MSAKYSVYEEQVIQEVKGVPEEYLPNLLCIFPFLTIYPTRKYLFKKIKQDISER
jgi:hypothetical protein